MEVRSICPYCGVGCGVLIDVHRGAVRSVRGDPGHPTNRGGLCAKGRRLAEAVFPGDRLLYPMSRSSQAEPFRRLSWSQAVERLASAIRRARDEHGPEAVALYLSGQLLTEDYYVANKLGKGLIGTPNVDTNSRLCMSSTVAAYKRAFGADGPPGCYEDLEQARDVFLFGSNAADTHPILFGRLLAARGRLNARWTVVDPRRTPTAEGADDHLQLRPGSDVALLLGMTQTLFEEELVDEARVRRTCVGLDELRTAASAMPAERAATLCELPASRIRSAARRLAASPAALSVWCQGLNQSSAGTDKVNALINLHLLTGQIGRPGTGPLSLTGQANAMGGREVGALATELAAHRGWDDPGRAEVEAAWRLGSLPSPQMGRGLTAVELVEAMLERRVRVLWVACSNPLASLPDGAAVREALRRLDLLVVQELYHPTDTGSLAHLLLPAAGWSEKTGTSTSSERRVGLARQVVDPPGEALPDWRIFAAVGSALGAPEAFGWEGPDQVFDEHVALTAGRDLDMSALSYRLLERDGPQLWPYPAGGTSQARRYVDGRYPTPGGRARLVAVAHREPSEVPSDAYPLRLTTGRDRDRWHTLTRTGRIAALRGAQSPVLSIHPSDAEVSGLADGEDAVISSPRGALRARVSVDGRQRPGTAYLPFHEGPLVAPDGWPNLLTERALDPLSFQPELKHATVRVGPARRAVALAGGPLAQAVGAELRGAGFAVRCLEPADLERAPPEVLRVVLGAGRLAGAAPWWEVAAKPPAGPGVALLELGNGPEPLAALPALTAAGWRVALGHDRWLPAPVRRLLRFDSEAEVGCLVVGAPPPAPSGGVPDGTLLLQPGGRLGYHQPVSGDPVTLAAYLAGRSGPRATVRRLLVPLTQRRSLLYAGDPLGHAPTDALQGVHLLVHEDGAEGTAQVWRLTAGQVLGVAAVLPPAVAEDAEALWLSDAEPATLRRRFPLR